MRVAYVCNDPGVPVCGNKGCSVHVQGMIHAFLKAGWEVDLLARCWERKTAANGHTNDDRVGGPGSALPTDERMFQRILLPPVPAGMNGEDRESFLQSTDRQVIFELEKLAPYDLVYERHALWSSAAMQWAEQTETPAILEVNAPLIEEQQAHRQLHDAVAAANMVGDAFAAATSIVAVSNGVAQAVRSRTSCVGKVQVVANGVCLERFTDAAEIVQERWTRRCRGEHIPVTMGFVGTLRPWHGMQYLGQAFRQFQEKHPDARLLIVGDGSARNELEAQLGAPGRAACQFSGKLAPEVVPRWVRQFDIALAPYPATDNFYFSPMKVMEYLAAGVPTIASNVGELAELLASSGVVVPAADASAIVTAAMDLLEQPARALSLSQAAVSQSTAFDWSRVLQRTLATLPSSLVDATATLNLERAG